MAPDAFMLPDSSTTWSILGAVLMGLVAGFARWWSSAKPARERAEAGWDAILGGQPIKDRSGAIIQEGKPGLVHRVTQLEVAVVTLADQQEQIKAIRDTIGLVRSDVDTLTASVAAIIADKYEAGTLAALELERQKSKSVIDVQED